MTDDKELPRILIARSMVTVEVEFLEARHLGSA